MNSPAPKTVQISPTVELGELAAQCGFLRHRNLILGQAVADLTTENAELKIQLETIATLQAENADLKNRLEALQVPATPAASGQTQEGE